MKRSTPAVVVMIVAMLLSGFSQAYLRGRKEQLQNMPTRQDQISGMDSMAVGLVLGGLRGPLVMALWTSSENQKIDQDLQSIDTKIELIRILQPNFDSVHIFQLWNKAFNLSAQMTSANDKYSMILEALEYGRRIDKDRPDNINILSSMARIYLDKFCMFEDRIFYDNRVRFESLAGNDAGAGNPLVSRRKFPVVLDKQGHILPEFLQGAKGVKVGPYNGAALQYLQRYSENGGFPYGVPPSALAFNYYRRSVDLLRYGKQKHAELSDEILETRDVFCLYNWAQDESFRAMRIEAGVYGKFPKIELKELEKTSQSIGPGDSFVVEKSVAAERFNEAIFSFWRSNQIAQDAVKDLQDNIDRNPFGDRVYTFLQHRDDSMVIARNSAADRLYLQVIVSETMLAPLPENTTRQQLIEQAIAAYNLSISESYRVMLQYYVEEEIAAIAYAKVLGEKPSRTPGRWTLDKVSPEKFPQLRAEYDAELDRNNAVDTHWVDASDYLACINRAQERIKILKSLQ